MAYSASLPHDEDLSMQGREFMTKDPITVSADTPTPEIARLLLARGISAAPVVGDGGLPIGMVSEGDLLGRGEADRQARRDWWLTVLAGGGAVQPEIPCPPPKPAAHHSRSHVRPSGPDYRNNRGSGNRPPPRGIPNQASSGRARRSHRRNCQPCRSASHLYSGALGAARLGAHLRTPGGGRRVLSCDRCPLWSQLHCGGRRRAARDAADRRGGWPDRDRFSRADRRFRASQYRASGGGAPVGGRETPASR